MQATLKLRRPQAPIRAVLRPPGSKSISNRALLFAAMADGMSEILGCLDADDTRLMLGCLRELGLAVTQLGDPLSDGLRVTGVGQRLGNRAELPTLQVGTAGTVARFLTAALATARQPPWGSVQVDGSARMRERPMATLLEALRELGAQFECHGGEGALPFTVRPPADGALGGSVTLSRPVSSQFVSALVIAGCACSAGLDIVLEQGTPARPYVDMTLRVLGAFGGSAAWLPTDELPEGASSTTEIIRVESRNLRPCTRYIVEPDASAASYLLALPVLYGGEVTVPDLGSESLQGDAQFWRVLEAFGGRGEQDESRTVMRGPDTPGQLRGQELDLTDMPDMTLTAAVVAAFATGPTRIRGVGILRHHESDRIAAGATELRKLGAKVEEHEDGLDIEPPTPEALRERLDAGVVIDTYEDHRMAMAFALAGDVTIADPGCVAKTFPRYFEVLDSVGMLPEPEPEPEPTPDVEAAEAAEPTEDADTE
nr:3-phosphoshikimate 1-carboxyvinyltransferase [Plesiocystis pacifica]